jgi:cation diffusion facilitator family transporter
MSKNAGGEAPFGYGRIEYMAGFISAVMILAAGVLFLYSAIERLLYPFLLLFSWLNFGIIAFGALIKVFLGLFFFGRNKKLDSIVLKGSGIDSFMDAGITLMTLVGYLTAGYIAPRADAFVGMIISIIIIVEGIKLIKNNAKALLGKNLDEKTKRSILKIAEKHGILADEGAITLHDYGKNRKIVIFDALIDSKDMSGLQEFKDAAESFTREASEKFDMEFKVCILPK